MIDESKPRLILDCRNNLGESIVWDELSARLWWANIHEGEIWSWDPEGTDSPKTWSLGVRICALGLSSGDRLIVALEKGFARFDPSIGRLEPIAEVEQDLPTTRLNDGRVDPAGRFICGGMDEAAPQKALSSLYALDGKGQPRHLLGDISCTNSLCWSPDGATMYFADMPKGTIEAFDYDTVSGAMKNRRVFADLSGEPGLPDGSTVDADGYLWNAQWGGDKLVRYAPSGAVDLEVAMPVSNPTCLCFGGRNLDTLFITSAWFGLDDAASAGQPHAGGLFALKPGARGQLEHRYAG
ncbi:SMP-30/gluconolactonase/LRE family protein [Neorhizobium sp. NCHU2750]|uniref:SMP-30/gluconolactonase/LRE family protein n=1 Tax=Neorhizobium sp. NCHU2750 TaxID=1825976 RepID=UPI000E7372F5|nr:hypothetical protein NCHU2750_47900 [Neorhizobium sp. NCHU2750]